MEIVIGTRSREIRLATNDTAKDLRSRIENAFSSPDGLLWLTDSDSREFCVPVKKITYIEIDSDTTGRRVGFVSKASSPDSGPKK